MELKLSELMKLNTNRCYRYVGTIWGSDPYEMTGAEIADMLTNQLPDFDGEIGEHPANKNVLYQDFDSGHYYIQSNSIFYVGYLIDEIVLDEIQSPHNAAVAMGKIGGSAKTVSKQNAARINGKLGGRPHKMAE